MTVSLAAVIPTRNRPDLAMAAARSLFDQNCAVEVFISDNSASGDALQSLCAAEPRIHYLRPPRELAMSEHWDWAIRQAMERSRATHFTVHYDRKFSWSHHWDLLLREAERRPETLFSFPVDHIAVYPPPRRLWQTPWTGKLYEVRTAHVAAVVARAGIAPYALALPMLSNCLIPRTVLDSVVRHFGGVCDSNGPDAAFMARFFALYDRYVHYDRPMGILYASERSNGMGYMRGKGGDFADYLKTWGDRPWLDAAPVPGLNLGYNMLYHEYEVVRRATGDRLPPLDRERVLEDLGASLRWIDEPAIRTRMRDLLREHGWRGADPEPLPPRNWRDRAHQWRLTFRQWRGHPLPNICGFAFRSDRDALAAALRTPRQPQDTIEHIAGIDPVEVQ